MVLSFAMLLPFVTLPSFVMLLPFVTLPPLLMLVTLFTCNIEQGFIQSSNPSGLIVT